MKFKYLIILLLLAACYSAFGQASGSFGTYYFDNVTKMNSTVVNNAVASASRRGYVADIAKWVRWNGTNWVLDDQVEVKSGCTAPVFTPGLLDAKIIQLSCGLVYRWDTQSTPQWILMGSGGGGGSDNWGTQVVITNTELSGSGTSGSPLRLATQSAFSGQILKFNGTTWVPGTDNGTSYTPGTGISIVTGTINNTGDLSNTNELNTSLSIGGGNLQLVDGGGTLTVPLTSISPVQSVVAGPGISIGIVGGVYTVNNTGDLSNTNEIQTLSIGTNSLTISGGNTVTVDTDPSDDLTTSSTAGGDLSGPFSNLQLNSGVVGSAEIANGGVGYIDLASAVADTIGSRVLLTNKTTDPSTSDTGYPLGSEWRNTVTGDAWILKSKVAVGTTSIYSGLAQSCSSTQSSTGSGVLMEQMFTATATGLLNQIKVLGSASGIGNSSTRLRVYLGSTSTNLTPSGYVPNVNFNGATAITYTFNFTTPISLVVGQQYRIELVRTSGGATASNWCQGATDFYSGGYAYNNSALDFIFETTIAVQPTGAVWFKVNRLGETFETDSLYATLGPKYGAYSGDGIDDGPAITKAAIDAYVNHKDLRIWYGDWNFDDSISIKVPINIVGMGPRSRLIFGPSVVRPGGIADGGCALCIDHFSSDATNTEKPRWYGFDIDLSAETDSVVAIDARKGIAYWQVEKVNVKGQSSGNRTCALMLRATDYYTGIKVPGDGSNNNHFSDCEFQTIQTGIYTFIGTGTGTPTNNANFFENLRVSSSENDAYLVYNGGQGNTYSECKLSRTGNVNKAGYVGIYSGNMVKFQNCYFDGIGAGTSTNTDKVVRIYNAVPNGIDQTEWFPIVTIDNVPCGVSSMVQDVNGNGLKRYTQITGCKDGIVTFQGVRIHGKEYALSLDNTPTNPDGTGGNQPVAPVPTDGQLNLYSSLTSEATIHVGEVEGGSNDRMAVAIKQTNDGVDNSTNSRYYLTMDDVTGFAPMPDAVEADNFFTKRNQHLGQIEQWKTITSTSYTVPSGAYTLRYNGTADATWTLPVGTTDKEYIIDNTATNSTTLITLTINRAGSDQFKGDQGAAATNSITITNTSGNKRVRLHFLGSNLWEVIRGGGDNWGTQVVSVGGEFSGTGASGSPLNIINGTITNQVLKWNGTEWAAGTDDVGAAGGISSLNSQTGASQTFANGTSGTSPNWSSASNVHTLNIPIASGTNTGALSNTDFSSFTNKLTSTLTSAHIFVGNGSNVATDVAVSGDLTLANTGAFTIANLAITNAKVNDVAWSKITSTPTTIAGYGITDAHTGTGANRQVTFWTGSLTQSGDVNFLYNSSGQLVVGTTTAATNSMLTTQGTGTTSTTFGYRHQNSSGTGVFAVRDDGGLSIGSTNPMAITNNSIQNAATSITTTSAGFTINSSQASSAAISLSVSSATFGGVTIGQVSPSTNTSPTLTIDGSSKASVNTAYTNLRVTGTYAPTSTGTGSINFLVIDPTLNQTGSNISPARGLVIAPVITSSASFIGTQIKAGSGNYAMYSNNGKWHINVGSDTTGNILVRNSSGDLQAIATGTSGYVLTSNGPFALPTYQVLPGGGGSGDVVGPASATDNAIARFDLTTGKLIQNSGATIDDSGNLTATNISGTNTGNVTLAGENYLSIVSQVITANAVNLSGTNVTGTLAAARFPALTGDVNNTVGTLATTITTDAVDGTNISLSSEATGAVMYFDGTNWVVLAPGASGTFLKSNGAGAAPSYSTPSGSGDVVGPSSATDEAVARFDGVTGKLIQNSTATLTDAGLYTLVTTTANTNTNTLNTVTYQGISSGTAATLFGINTDYQLEAADASVVSVGKIGVQWSDAAAKDGRLVFSTTSGGTSSERMWITSGGRVGVGVNNPSGQLSNSSTSTTDGTNSVSATVGLNWRNSVGGYTGGVRNTNSSGGHGWYVGTASTSTERAFYVEGGSNIGFQVLANGNIITNQYTGYPKANGTSVWTASSTIPATDLSGLGTGIGAWLATPSSANLATAMTDETGTGALVFATSPTFVTPVLGTPTSGTLTNATGLPISSGVSGLGTGVATFLATPSSANLLAAVTDETGTGALVFGTAPTFTTSITMADGANVIVGTTTGTKIGTSTSQKLGFFNSTPVVQPTGSIITALTNLGLVASPTLAESEITFTDITTNNSSTSKHGYLKKLSNVATEYMDGTGNWSTPAGATVTNEYYITGQTGTTLDLSTGTKAKTKGTGTGVNLDLPTDVMKADVLINGFWAGYTDGTTTREYSYNASTEVITFTNALTTGTVVTVRIRN